MYLILSAINASTVVIHFIKEERKQRRESVYFVLSLNRCCAFLK